MEEVTIRSVITPNDQFLRKVFSNPKPYFIDIYQRVRSPRTRWGDAKDSCSMRSSIFGVMLKSATQIRNEGANWGSNLYSCKIIKMTG